MRTCLFTYLNMGDNIISVIGDLYFLGSTIFMSQRHKNSPFSFLINWGSIEDSQIFEVCKSQTFPVTTWRSYLI